MGFPSAAALHAMTDKVAAMINADLAGFDSEATANTNSGLWALIDASPDPAVVSALSAAADAVDSQYLPANFSAALARILSRPAYQGFFGSLRSLAGTVYPDLEAALEALPATLDPIFAELAYAAGLGRSGFRNKATPAVVTQVNNPPYTAGFFRQVYAGTDGSLADLTAASQSATTADMTLFASNHDAVYYGARHKFSQLIQALSTKANVSAGLTFKYWNGNAWVVIPGLVDNTANFTRNDTVAWVPPADWQRTYKDASGAAFANQAPLFYLRVERTASTLGTPPVGTCATMVQEPTLLGTTNHYGVAQPPLAVVRIDAASALHVVAGSLLTDFPTIVDTGSFKAPALRLRCLAPPGGNLTPTVSYVNQAGVNQTQAQGAWTSPAALAVVAVTLNGADTGAQKALATGWACTTSAVEGVFAVEAVAVRTPAL